VTALTVDQARIARLEDEVRRIAVWAWGNHRAPEFRPIVSGDIAPTVAPAVEDRGMTTPTSDFPAPPSALSMELRPPLSADQLARIGQGWIDDALAEFERLNADGRKAAADESIAMIRQCLLNSDDPRTWTLNLGRHAWRARILMAEN
jgi:hypothetical protein